MSGFDLVARALGYERIAKAAAAQPREQVPVGPYVWPAWRQGQPDWTPATLLGYAEAGYEANSLVLACIRRRAQSAAFAPLVAYTGERAKPERLPDAHQLAHLLRRPNPYQSWYQFMEQGITYLDLDGNLFVYMVGLRVGRREAKARTAGEYPQALFLLRSDRVRVVPGRERGQPLLGYVYDPDDSGQWLTREPFLPEEVIHVKYPNPRDPFEGFGRGTSPLGAAVKQVDVDNAATSFLKNFFDQGVVPYGLLKSRQQLMDSDIARIRGRLREQYAGVQNWGDTMILDADADYQRMGMSFQEMTFDALDMRNEARICHALDIPPILVGARVGLNASTYSNYEQARRAFWQDALRPGLYQRLEDEFNEALSNDTDKTWVAYDYTDVPALREDESAKATVAVTVFAGRVAKLNEARGMLDLEPVPDEEDGFFAGEQAAVQGILTSPTPGVIKPGEQADRVAQAQQQAEAQAMLQQAVTGAGAPGASPEQGQPPAAQPPEANVVAVGEGEKRFPFWDGTKAATRKLSEGCLEERRQIEDHWAGEIERTLQKQLQQALPPGTTTQTVWQALDRLTASKQLLHDVLWQMCRETIALGLESADLQLAEHTHAVKAAGMDVDWSLVNSHVLEWLDQYMFDLVSNLTANSRKALEGSINRWISNGLPLKDLVAELTPAFGKVRAEMIAATEVTRAYTEANCVYWQDTGIVEYVEWRTANDERVCPICAPLGGLNYTEDGEAMPAEIDDQERRSVRAGLGETFRHPGGGGKADGNKGKNFSPPPAHVRCRCWLVPGWTETRRIKRPAQAQDMAQLADWFKRNYPWLAFEGGDMDLGLAVQVAERWQQLAQDYPSVAEWVRYIGIQQGPGLPAFSGPNVYAHAYYERHIAGTPPHGKGGYIGLNPAWWRDAAKLQASMASDVASGWHPKGTADPGSMFEHEFGHILDFFIKEHAGSRAVHPVVGIDGFGAVGDTFDMFKERSRATKFLSRYALVNHDEAWAEGFVASRHQPRAQWTEYQKRQQAMLDMLGEPDKWPLNWRRRKTEDARNGWVWVDDLTEEQRKAYYEWRAAQRRKLGIDR